jgi:hypothetical protein
MDSPFPYSLSVTSFLSTGKPFSLMCRAKQKRGYRIPGSFLSLQHSFSCSVLAPTSKSSHFPEFWRLGKAFPIPGKIKVHRHLINGLMYTREAVGKQDLLHDSFQKIPYSVNKGFWLFLLRQVPAIGNNHQLSVWKFPGKPEALFSFDRQIVFASNDQ